MHPGTWLIYNSNKWVNWFTMYPGIKNYVSAPWRCFQIVASWAIAVYFTHLHPEATPYKSIKDPPLKYPTFYPVFYTLGLHHCHTDPDYPTVRHNCHGTHGSHSNKYSGSHVFLTNLVRVLEIPGRRLCSLQKVTWHIWQVHIGHKMCIHVCQVGLFMKVDSSTAERDIYIHHYKHSIENLITGLSFMIRSP